MESGPLPVALNCKKYTKNMSFFLNVRKAYPAMIDIDEQGRWDQENAVCRALIVHTSQTDLAYTETVDKCLEQEAVSLLQVTS